MSSENDIIVALFWLAGWILGVLTGAYGVWWIWIVNGNKKDV